MRHCWVLVFSSGRVFSILHCSAKGSGGLWLRGYPLTQDPSLSLSIRTHQSFLSHPRFSSWSWTGNWTRNRKALWHSLSSSASWAKQKIELWFQELERRKEEVLAFLHPPVQHPHMVLATTILTMGHLFPGNRMIMGIALLDYNSLWSLAVFPQSHVIFFSTKCFSILIQFSLQFGTMDIDNFVRNWISCEALGISMV